MKDVAIQLVVQFLLIAAAACLATVSLGAAHVHVGFIPTFGIAAALVTLIRIARTDF